MIEIALVCGFNSHSHLSKQFRQLTGIWQKAEGRRQEVKVLLFLASMLSKCPNLCEYGYTEFFSRINKTLFQYCSLCAFLTRHWIWGKG
ncbi:hypothetical protein [Nostoc sp. CCY 9925]|uniref:hypothetical protein n=1 Tax=Nostoc sp. CCY 9925 TaxID=3103865 RepID=UPI0039C5DA7C